MKTPLLTRAQRKQKNQAGAKRWNAVCRLAARLLKGIPERQYEATLRRSDKHNFPRLQKLRALLESQEHRFFYMERCNSYDLGLSAHIFQPFNLIGL